MCCAAHVSPLNIFPVFNSQDGKLSKSHFAVLLAKLDTGFTLRLDIHTFTHYIKNFMGRLLPGLCMKVYKILQLQYCTLRNNSDPSFRYMETAF